MTKILALSFCIAIAIVSVSTTLAILYTPKPVGGTVYLNIDKPNMITKPIYKKDLGSYKGIKTELIDNLGK